MSTISLVYFLEKKNLSDFMYLISIVKTSNGKSSSTEIELEKSLC